MTHASLFSGIGGFDLAARNVGCTNVFTCEIDEHCQKVLAKNFPGLINYNDVTTFDAIHYRDKVNVLSGGFPCQDISLANSNERKGLDGARSGLFFQMIRIVNEVKPQYVVYENSPMVLGSTLLRIHNEFRKLDYVNFGKLITAESLGFPHKRKRYYGVAIANSCGIGLNKVSLLSRVFQKNLSKKLYKKQENDAKFSRTFARELSVLPNSEFLRTTDGFSQRLDKDFVKEQEPRIKALGNAIVPVIAEVIFESIKEVENEST